ncbi:hypothetical protein KEM52_000335 [Ascosphaera acerosa]|nr:hypothetical protein KEM52_000335 [Ascosphaera acerosa]
MARSHTWTDQADARLLAAIIATVPSIDYQLVADILGNGLSANAVHHRIRKIKSKAAGSGVASDSGGVTPASSPVKKPRSPVKRALQSPARATVPSVKARKIAHSSDDDEEEEGGEGEDGGTAADAKQQQVPREQRAHELYGRFLARNVTVKLPPAAAPAPASAAAAAAARASAPALQQGGASRDRLVGVKKEEARDEHKPAVDAQPAFL